MSEYVDVPGIVGTDNQIPLWNPNARFTIYNKDEVFLGTIGKGKYVPNVKDLVVDTTNDYLIIEKVVAINEVTFVPELKKMSFNTGDDGTLSEQELLLGVGPGTASDTYRCYINKNIYPYTLSVERRLKIPGAKSCRIFRGTDLSDTSKIISQVYDNAMNFVNNDVLLELVKQEGNKSIKYVPTCYTVADLEDGEIVTAVFYGEENVEISIRQMLVKNTSFIASPDDSIKYVTGIRLKSPFMSEADAKVLNYPINVPLIGMFLTGVVEYSDGTTLELPIDNTKFSIFGFDNFIATIIGEKQKLTLKYKLSDGEVCYDAQNVGNNYFKTENYNLIVTKADGSYTCKLFGYPHWVDGVSGYQMRWWLYNLERNIHYNVTPYVRLAEDSADFKPLLYGTRQRLVAVLNLKDVSTVYESWRHVQTLDVTLRNEGGHMDTNWTVAFTDTQDPIYGNDNHFQYEFVNQNLKRLKINMGLTDQATWLQRLYYNTLPLVNPYNEAEAIVPDWFAIITESGTRVEYQLSQWNQEFAISDTIHHGSTLFVEFFKRMASNDLLLGIAGVPVQQVSSIDSL